MIEKNEKHVDNVLNHILQQIDWDTAALETLQPQINWKDRVSETVRKFVPGLVDTAGELITEVEQILNSPQTARGVWNQLKHQLQDRHNEDALKIMDSALAQEQMLLAVITGETISKLIADFLCRMFPNLRQNNRSTYPDLYFIDVDYSILPRRSRDLAKGPALRGVNPTSVPDGIEIKSNNGTRIRVDSHHPHQGLHLVLTYSYEAGVWRVYDIYLAYLSESSYKRATRQTTATTEKFSFGHAPFISVTEGKLQQGQLIYGG